MMFCTHEGIIKKSGVEHFRVKFSLDIFLKLLDFCIGRERGDKLVA